MERYIIMCIESKSSFMVMGWFIFGLIERTDKGNMTHEKFEEHIKDELADAKEAGLISHCGCEGDFFIKKISSEDTLGYNVYIEINSKLREFAITYSNKYFGQGDMKYSIVSRHDVMDGYDDMVYNEYIDDKPLLTEEDLRAFISGDEFKLK